MKPISKISGVILLSLTSLFYGCSLLQTKIIFQLRSWRLIGIALLLISGNSMVFAQANEPYIYGEMGGGDGSHGLFQMTLNTVFSKNQVISISYYYASHRSANAPADFHPGLLESFPQQTLSVFGLSYGGVFFFKNPCVRGVLKGGLCAGVAATPVGFEYNPMFLSSNYSFSHQDEFVIGLVFNPVIEFPVGRGFGFSIGPYANINAVSSVFALEASMMFGKLRGKKDKSR